MNKDLRKLCFGFFAIVIFNLKASAQGYIVHDLNTGIINGTTTPIPYGSQDDTWKCSLPSTPTNFFSPVVCSDLGGAWDSNICGRWITNKVSMGSNPPNAHQNAAAGIYTYKTTFNMTTNCLTWVKVNLKCIGGDNNILGFKINGHSYPLNLTNPNDYNPLTQNYSFYVLASEILIGTNTILIQLNNSESFQGLFICGDVSVQYCPKN